MIVEFPEIITELTGKAKSEELRHFDLSSFMSDKSLEDTFNTLDKSMQFFSVYVDMKHLQEDLWEGSRYVDKQEIHLCSLVEAEVRRYWWDRNTEHLERIDELMASYGNDPNYKTMT